MPSFVRPFVKRTLHKVGGVLGAQVKMRIVSPTGSLLAWEDDPDGYHEGVDQLGLDHDAVLAEFGLFTQLHFGQGTISRDQTQLYLHRRFPDVVSVPFANEAGASSM